MNVWMDRLDKIIISILGVNYSSTERLVIAFLGIITFFIVLKLFTGIKGVYNTSDLRRVLGGAIIISVLLSGAVLADIYVIPYVTSFALRNIIYFAVPLLLLAIIGIPLLMVVFKKGYGDSLVTALSAVAGFAIVVFVAGFIISSMQQTGTEFKHLKGRTRTIDSFINH